MKQNKRVRDNLLALLVLSSGCSLLSTAAIANSTELIFCYEDKTVAPMFLAQSNEMLGTQPKASLEILQNLDNTLSQLSIRYQRKAWLSCLNDLRTNKVNAVIATYRPERTEFAQYPMDGTQQLDPRFAVSEFGSCLIGGKKFHQQWQSREVFQTRAFTLAIANGYDLGKVLHQEPFFVQHTSSVEKAVELIDRGVVDATLDVCQVGDRKVSNFRYKTAQVQAIYPPLEKAQGYLLFSKQFYQQHKALSQRIWQTIAAQDNAKLYVEYLDKTNHEARVVSSRHR